MAGDASRAIVATKRKTTSDTAATLGELNGGDRATLGPPHAGLLVRISWHSPGVTLARPWDPGLPPSGDWGEPTSFSSDQAIVKFEALNSSPSADHGEVIDPLNQADNRGNRG